MNADRTGAAVVIAIGVGYLWSALSVPTASIGDPLGPKSFPIILSGLMVFLGVTIFARPDRDIKAPSLKNPFSTVVLLAGMLGLYGFSLPWIGYPVGTFIFLFLGSRMLKERSWVKGVALSAALSLAIFALFTKVLGIPLPLGVIKTLAKG